MTEREKAEREKLERAMFYAKQLAEGIDPTTGAAVPENDVVNDVRISRCLFYIADILRQVRDRELPLPNAAVHTSQVPLSIPYQKQKQFAYSAEAITVTALLQRINDLREDERMAPLTSSALTAWLLGHGLLEWVQDSDCKMRKQPTPKGFEHGLILEKRTGYAPYSVTLYTLSAQKMILRHLDEIIAEEHAFCAMKGAPWTKEQDALLLKLFTEKSSANEIAVALKRSTSAVRARLKALGVV